MNVISTLRRFASGIGPLAALVASAVLAGPMPPDGESSVISAPASFALIPAGTFTMGNALWAGEGNQFELPTHPVTLGAFYMAKTLTTWGEWQSVRSWAMANGYLDLADAGGGSASTHPVSRLTWFGILKWCNAKSEMEGLTPCYYTNDAQTIVYRTGSAGISNVQVKWTANGYRLPTEAEWEYAARGGLSGARFPWGDAISHSQANYRSSTAEFYDVSPSRGFHPDFSASRPPNTSPVDAFAPNGYGLHDMAGNVWQWCWDWYGSYSAAAQTAPLGPASGSDRVARGGSWTHFAWHCRTAYRYNGNPGLQYGSFGFRCVRTAVDDGR